MVEAGLQIRDMVKASPTSKIIGEGRGGSQPATFSSFNIGWDLMVLNLTVTHRTSS